MWSSPGEARLRYVESFRSRWLPARWWIVAFVEIRKTGNPLLRKEVAGCRQAWPGWPGRKKIIVKNYRKDYSAPVSSELEPKKKSDKVSYFLPLGNARVPEARLSFGFVTLSLDFVTLSLDWSHYPWIWSPYSWILSPYPWTLSLYYFLWFVLFLLFCFFGLFCLFCFLYLFCFFCTFLFWQARTRDFELLINPC